MLDSDQGDTFAVIVDVLIPASDPMPSATGAGVPGALIDQVLGYRPDLVEAFGLALTACAGKDPEAALDELATEHPDQFEALTLLTAGAYFQSPLVKKALAYEPAPRAVQDDVDTYVDMLEAVVERGFQNR
ncbi:hypothetical protein [Streptomyces sp. NBC_01320]|uniref:hypothetical protein n=1 Tax=Streptomyces sp. NBC_01320 TaxID=2903824 RepID=UPI002E149102|nr:gluconate 2-dehydrogenase subunit 3 family protein [Streptomyces sp. NBC_01320]